MCINNSIISLSYFRASVDCDGDGDISKEEFVKNAMESKFIHDILTQKK